jgi:hypothetical protein
MPLTNLVDCSKDKYIEEVNKQQGPVCPGRMWHKGGSFAISANSCQQHDVSDAFLSPPSTLTLALKWPDVSQVLDFASFSYSTVVSQNFGGLTQSGGGVCVLIQESESTLRLMDR